MKLNKLLGLIASMIVAVVMSLIDFFVVPFRQLKARFFAEHADRSPLIPKLFASIKTAKAELFAPAAYMRV